MNLALLGFLALNFIFSTAGDSVSKLWAMHPGPKWALVTVGFSMLASFTWMLVIRQSSLAVGSSIMLLVKMLSTVLTGIFVFKEHITHGQEAGIILGFITALFLLNIIRIP